MNCELLEATREAWALLPEHSPALVRQLSAGSVAVEASRKRRAPGRKGGAVAILPIEGVITHRGWLGVPTSWIAGHLRKMVADDSIGAVILDIDSPGGAVSGVEELAREIHAAKAKKPIVAVANSMAASAAYWIASQASEVVVTPSGEVGGIGVFAMHADISQALEKKGVAVSLIHAGRHKVEGNPYQPLGGEARAEMQSKVDGFYGMFVGAVRRGRGALSDEVMQGRMYSAQAALRHGLVDRVATLEETVARLRKG